jgi:predicted DsbA family dithiol-disulfide isomerase
MDTLSPQFDFDVDYLPFELNPDMPTEGKLQKEYLSEKFGSVAQYSKLTGHVTQVAAEEGLKFNFEKQQVSPNTREAHRLIWFARQFGKQAAMKEALLNAYFEQGVDLSKNENLVTLAKAVGLEEDRVTEFLNSEEGTTEVVYAEQLNVQRGVRGVPFYIVNNQYGISGAQPAEAFVQALRQIGNEKSAAGESCEPGVC